MIQFKGSNHKTKDSGGLDDGKWFGSTFRLDINRDQHLKQPRIAPEALKTPNNITSRSKQIYSSKQ